MRCDDDANNGGDDGGSQNNILVGTKWTRTGSDGLKDSFEFISNTECIFSQNDEENSTVLAYNLSGSTVTIYPDQFIVLTIAGNTLTSNGVPVFYKE